MQHAGARPEPRCYARNRHCTEGDTEPEGFPGWCGDDRAQSVFACLRWATRWHADAAAGGAQPDAGAAPWLPDRRAVGGLVARGSEHRCRASMAAAGMGNGGTAAHGPTRCHGTPASLSLTLPPLAPLLMLEAERYTDHGRLLIPLARMTAGSSPDPLGANWDGLGVNFAVFSAQRRRGSSYACSIPPAGANSRALRCPNAPTRSGTAICPDAQPGQLYGYRAYGPYEPAPATASTPTSCCSILMRSALHGESALEPTRCTATGSAAPAPTCPSTAATARRPCRKAVVVDDSFNWGDDRPPGAVGTDRDLRGAPARPDHATR